MYKVKRSLLQPFYRPRGVPGSWGSHIYPQAAHEAGTVSALTQPNTLPHTHITATRDAENEKQTKL